MIFHGVPLDCINHAAQIFHIPATMIISVIKIENGHNGSAVKNKNGTYDLGVMQVNSIWVSQLKSYGITREDLQFNPCVNVHTATWILAKGMSKGEGWKGVGNYHSSTPVHNLHYREMVKAVYEDVQRTLYGELA